MDNDSREDFGEASEIQVGTINGPRLDARLWNPQRNDEH